MIDRDEIRLSRVHYPVTALGPGMRLGVWVQGCTLGCRGCMSRDTWDINAGWSSSVADLIEHWRVASSRGAIGLTITGGEPSLQVEPLCAFIDAVRQHSHPTSEVDVLLFTGLEASEIDATSARLIDRADAVILGRFVVTQPTDLLWRGSANQQLRLQTDLGRRRYTAYLSAESTAPEIQFAVDANRIWTIGVPRIGDLNALERTLRAEGIEMGTVSWRP